MIVTVQEIVESDSFNTQHGLLYGWKFVATDEQGNQHWLGINTKKPDGLAVGKTFDFLASGKMAGVYTLGKRADQNQGSAYKAPANAQGAPQSHANPQGAAQVATPLPTVTERGLLILELMPRAIKLAAHVAPPGTTADGIMHTATSITMNWIISLERKEIRPDPSAAQIAAEQEAAAAADRAEVDRLQKLADEATERLRGRTTPASAPERIPLSEVGYVPSERDPNSPDGVVF